MSEIPIMERKLTWPTGYQTGIDQALRQVGPGWAKLVGDLIEDLFAAGWDGRIQQIKEKFGSLRFYARTRTDEQQMLIDAAAEKSSVTCEKCGEPGQIRPGGWIVCLCLACHERIQSLMKKDIEETK